MGISSRRQLKEYKAALGMLILLFERSFQGSTMSEVRADVDAQGGENVSLIERVAEDETPMKCLRSLAKKCFSKLLL